MIAEWVGNAVHSISKAFTVCVGGNESWMRWKCCAFNIHKLSLFVLVAMKAEWGGNAVHAAFISFHCLCWWQRQLARTKMLCLQFAHIFHWPLLFVLVSMLQFGQSSHRHRIWAASSTTSWVLVWSLSASLPPGSYNSVTQYRCQAETVVVKN